MLDKFISKERNFGLDLLRFYAIFSVVYAHGSWLFKEIPILEYSDRVFFIDGVELFFVLSGFLIGGILLRNFSKIEVKKILLFYKDRWFRTLPNYYLFLVINIFLSIFLFQEFNIDFSKYFIFYNISFLIQIPKHFLQSHGA